MYFSNYIVPIYSDEEFLGTGFIIKGLLITAFHVIERSTNLWFCFDNKRIVIDSNRYLLKEGDNDDKENLKNIILYPERAQDIFVYETEIEKSDLILSSFYEQTQVCEFFGYSFDDENRFLRRDEISDIKIIRTEALTNHYGQIITLNNCMSCQCSLVSGNSGGPLMQNGKVIGMLIRGVDYRNGYHECTFIKACYILQKIEKKHI